MLEPSIRTWIDHEGRAPIVAVVLCVFEFSRSRVSLHCKLARVSDSLLQVTVQVAFGAKHLHQILFEDVHGTYSLVVMSSTARRSDTKGGGPSQ
jgi:hypothetical protein